MFELEKLENGNSYLLHINDSGIPSVYVTGRKIIRIAPDSEDVDAGNYLENFE